MTKEKRSFLNDKVIPFASKLSQNKGLMAIRDGMGFAITLIIIGSIPLIINSLPIDGWTDTLTKIKVPYFGNLSQLLTLANNMTFGVMAIPAVFGMAYSYTKNSITDEVKSIGAGFIALASFLFVTPVITAKDGVTGVDLNYLGSKGLLVGIIIALATAQIFSLFIKHNIEIKLPDSVPPAIGKTFSALIPGIVIIIFWGIIAIIIGALGFDNVHVVLLEVLHGPLTFLGGTIFGTLIAVGLNGLVWTMGIHGTTINSAMNPIWLMNSDANRLAIQHGQAPKAFFTNSFIDNFVFMGGSGSVLSLVLAMLILILLKKSSAEIKTLTPLAVAPSLFNINEPIMFGLPIVFNPLMFIPFIITPMVFTLTTYLSMKFGWVAMPTGVVLPWTMPVLFSGFLATNSLSGAVIQLVNIILGIFIYFPFISFANQQQVKAQNKLEADA
ncbi:PTS sugar transporter subunit IIC [Latilactobacillus curvatus]|uniref:PTS sugar transporter subunit IIC n=1 Tax=Latilactobacillus curvatus TaxID=28038 RepID=UPI000FECD5E3|nr:PTS transporter subunit EIIC [Latilactobacillus curvatus]QAR35040.1 PTS sugar transporter subunit IIC [Latilactobacillus curvatus]